MLAKPRSKKPAEPPRFFDLAKHRFDVHFAPGIQGSPGRAPYFRGHALLGRSGRLSLLSLRDMVSLTACGRYTDQTPTAPRLPAAASL